MTEGLIKKGLMLIKENTDTDYILNKESLFWTPEYLDLSAWMEHIPFAFWIVEVLRPSMIVELGVHTGTSYFSFCQAVKRLNLNSTCFGVDTWRGDEHSGLYEEEIFNKVSRENNDKYTLFSTLVRSAFDEANEYFIDGSVELLHIDGLHTYEAVRHDFETWLPKLSPDAVVIFHDINVRERNFGVFKLWEELKQKYRHFQFDFGYGLGVLVTGDVPAAIAGLLNTSRNEDYYIFLRNLFSERGRFIKRTFDLECQIEQENANTEVIKKNLLQFTDTFEKTKDVLEKTKRENERLTKENKIIDEEKEKLKKKNRTFEEDLNNEIAELNISLQKKSEIIHWYKETWENRTLAGVMKEKLMSALKKKPNNRGKYNSQFQRPISNMEKMDGHSNRTRQFIDARPKKYFYYLEPGKDIRFLPLTLEYETTGPDPYFNVELKNKELRGGWYSYSIHISETQGIILAPKLYYDTGNGFNEKEIWCLPDLRNGKMEGLIKFPCAISALRFDPTIRDCKFSVKEFNLKPISTAKALLTGISGYKKYFKEQESFFSFYTGLFSTFLKSGKSALREKVWQAITYREIDSKGQYQAWCKMYDEISPDHLRIIKSLSSALPYQPTFSFIMPVYNAPIDFLRKAIESVRNQAYKNWELCIADDHSTHGGVRGLLKQYMLKDKRIKVVFRESNGHISEASNSALELATGEYVVLLDQDDEVPVHCLYMVASAINKNRDLKIIYSDEDKIDEDGNRFDPYFKTDWNKDLFYGQNMISHLGIYKRSLVEKIGGFRAGYEGSQDYDLALRCIEYSKPHQICHIPHVLYHWRAVAGSTSINMANKNYAFDAGINTLKDHLIRTGQNAVVEPNLHNSYRIKWSLPDQLPLVSIIIPTKEKADVLKICLTSILEKTSYPNFEILVIDNNSTESLTLEYLDDVRKNYEQVSVYEYEKDFNFSAIVNYGVKKSKGEVVLLLNNDTEVINSEWLTEMVSQCMRKEIGAVGAKLFYPNGRIQHAGVVLFEGHPGNHIYLEREKSDPGYFNKLNLVQGYSAVTAACLAVRKKIYMEVGGFDDENLKVAYNDVDFCLKVQEAGYNNLFTPFASLVHHESLSRGNDLDSSNIKRFRREHSFMLNKWDKLISKDPYLNPNLDPTFDPSGVQGIVRFAFPPLCLYDWQRETIPEHKAQLAL